MVTNVPADPDSDPGSSYYSFFKSSNSPDNDYFKRIQGMKNNKNKHRGKTRLRDLIKNCTNIAATYKSKFIKFKLDKGPLQHQVYFISLMNSLKIVYHNLRKLTLYYGLYIHERGSFPGLF